MLSLQTTVLTPESVSATKIYVETKISVCFMNICFKNILLQKKAANVMDAIFLCVSIKIRLFWFRLWP